MRTRRPCVVRLLNYRKDGSTFLNQITMAPVRDGAGRLLQFIGIQRDVTRQAILSPAIPAVTAAAPADEATTRSEARWASRHRRYQKRWRRQ